MQQHKIFTAVRGILCHANEHETFMITRRLRICCVRQLSRMSTLKRFY